MEDCEEVLFHVEVEVGLEVAETDWGLKCKALALSDVWEVLDSNVGVKVVDCVDEICFEDFFEIGLYLWLEVVKSID